MSFADLLINSCTTQRFTETAVTDFTTYGVPAKAWSDHLVDEPCRLVSGVGREVQVGAQVVIAEYTLFVGDVDITEQDRVIVDEITYEILLVTNRQNGAGAHHKECLLRTVR